MPHPVLEALVAALVPAARHEEVLGDLCERYTGPWRYVFDALQVVLDDELVDLLQETYDSHHFSDRVGAEGLVFDFLLRPGPATTRNAVALLAQRGAPTRVVSRALATATALDAHRRRAG